MLLLSFFSINIFFHENYFSFFMFRDVPECSGMFHVPDFIDALPNHEELCNTKLTCKRGRPSVTIKSRTKQLFVESYSGSRQDILQLLQT